MLDLTPSEANAIKDAAYTRDMLIRQIGYAEHVYPGKCDHEQKQMEINALEHKIRDAAGIPINQSIDDIVELIYYTLNLPPPDVRMITVDDLPKEPRETRFPKVQKPAVLAKKAAKFINRMRLKGTPYRDAYGRSMVNLRWDARRHRYVRISREDRITHIATGRVWDATTGAKADEFLEVMK